MSEKIAKEQFSGEKLDLHEDIERSKSHYEQPAEFYRYMLGGEWQVYSSLYWPDETTTGAQAQELKLDLLAKMMGLKPGMRVLEVGCGWGGPLTYFAKKYGVSGVGLTISPKQRDAAQARAEEYEVNAQFLLTHWDQYEPGEQFDAIYTDEVIVHFHNLDEFFQKAYEWLKMDGIFLNKELHFNHRKYAIFDRLNEHVFQIFGSAGIYRPLWEELKFYEDAGFELVDLFEIPMESYRRTMDFWLSNLFENREAVKELVGKDVYMDFRKYLKAMRRVFVTNAMRLDVIATRKIDPSDHPPLA